MCEKIFLHSILPLLGVLVNLILDAILLTHYWSQSAKWMWRLTLILTVLPVTLEAWTCILMTLR